MRVGFNIEKVKTLSEHQPDSDEEDRRGNDRCSRGNPGPQNDRHESQAQRTEFHVRTSDPQGDIGNDLNEGRPPREDA
jgi:hypothetical protein